MIVVRNTISSSFSFGRPTALLTLLLMTAKSMLSKLPVLRILLKLCLLSVIMFPLLSFYSA